MDAYEVDRDEEGRESVRIPLRGRGLLTHNIYNRGTAFTPDERTALGVSGLLPSGFSTLEAQVRRATAQPEQTTIRVGDLVIDLLSRECHRGDQPIDLKQREFQLLEFIMRHAGHVVTRTMILENVWDYNFNPQTNVIDVHISRLRQKIDKTFDRPLLHTVRGAGYVIREPE